MKARRGFWILIAILLIATAIYYPYSPAGTQRRNASLAEKHIQFLQPILAADKRFNEIDLSTRGLGYLQVACEVASEADRNALMEIVKKSNPPVPVIFRVTLIATSRPAID